MPIRVVVADDHPLVLSALEKLLADSDEFEIVASCRDGGAAIQAVRVHAPDLLLLDLHMPGGDGLSVLRQLRQDGADTATVMFVGDATDEQMREAEQLGVAAILMKGVPPRELLSRVRQIYQEATGKPRTK